MVTDTMRKTNETNRRKPIFGGFGKAVVTGLLALVAGCTTADKSAIDAYANATIKNKYVASGFNVVDNPVMQVSGGAVVSGYDVNVWANQNLDDNSTTEVDFSVTRGFELTDSLEASLTAAHYTFPGLPANDAQEISGSISTKGFPINGTLKGSQIFGDGSGHGHQLNGSLSGRLPIGDNLGLSGTLGAIWNNHYFTESEGFSIGYAQVGLDTNYKGWNISAHVLGQEPLDEGSFGDAFSRDTVYGFTVGRTFGGDE